MTPARESPSEVARETWGVCAAYTPAHAGLYQAIGDFAKALDSSILAFDGTGGPLAHEPGVPDVFRVRPWPPVVNRAAHVVWGGMRRAADALVVDAATLFVHSLFRGHAPWAASWAARTGRSYVAIPHGCLDPWGMAQKPVGKRLWMAACGRDYLAGAAAVVFSTRRELEKARPWLDRDDATVIRWPVAADETEAGLAVEERAAFRRRHEIASDARVLLFLGRLHSLKRPAHTIAAFVEARPQDAVLVMAGMDGDVTSRELVAAIPPAARAAIRVIGPVHDTAKREAFHASDGFVSLSFRENFGYSMAEALAHGLPVIVSPGHDLAADIAAESGGRLPCGWLLGSDSRSEAAAAISAFASLPVSRLRACGAEGRAWVTRHLSWAAFGSDVRSLMSHRCPASGRGSRRPDAFGRWYHA